jgi:hypothetical protein
MPCMDVGHCTQCPAAVCSLLMFAQRWFARNCKWVGAAPPGDKHIAAVLPTARLAGAERMLSRRVVAHRSESAACSCRLGDSLRPNSKLLAHGNFVGKLACASVFFQ